MGLYINLFFALIFVVFTFYYIRKNVTLTLIFWLIFFQAYSVFPSLIYIEQGIYINEQGRQSFFAGATIICILYFILTFVLLELSFKSFNKKKLPTLHLGLNKKNIDSKVLIFLITIAMFLLLLNAILSPLPMFNPSITRFNYWQNSFFPFLNKIFGNTAIFIPFGLGVLFLKHKKYSIIMLLIFVFYTLLIGQKFSPLVASAYSFLLPILFNYRFELKKVIIKNLFPLTVSFLVLFGLMYAAIYKKYEETHPFAVIKIYDPNEAIVYRMFGLQGHLFWGATERYVVNNTKPKSFNPTDLLYGMRHMMADFAENKGVLKANDKVGYNFTNAYPGILFKIFPISLAFVFHSFLTICFLALMGWILKETLAQKALFLSVIAYQIFNWTVYAFIMGYFYKLYFTIFFLFMYGLFIYIRKKNA